MDKNNGYNSLMNNAYSSQELLARLGYMVVFKQISIASARGYELYDDVDGLSLFWTDIDEDPDKDLIADQIAVLMSVFEEHEKTNTINEERSFELAELPSYLVFYKHTYHRDEGEVVHWLISAVLQHKEVVGRKVINQDSYESVIPPVARFSDAIIQHADDLDTLVSVVVEVYNPLIYKGLAPMKGSAESGLYAIERSLRQLFGDQVKVSEVNSNHMLGMISNHVFAPEISYIGNVGVKERVDDIYASTASGEEIEDERFKRFDIIMDNLPGVTIEEIERNEVKLFSTINPRGALASHYGFVVGDLVYMSRIIPSGKSSSARRDGLFLVD